MIDSHIAISKMFYNLRNELDTEITIHLNPNWKIPTIDKNSSVILFSFARENT